MKEVTIKIEDEAYEYFKAEDCNKTVQDFIALAAWNFFKMESEGEI